MTLVTSGPDEIVEQVGKQLNTVIDVVKLVNVTDDVHVERELILIKVKAENGQRDEVKRIVDIFHGHVIDMTDATYTIEVTGDSEKIDALLEALEHITMLEVVRSGQLGMGRGSKGMV
jgi:acetolactate synthase-1/3 small subunit